MGYHYWHRFDRKPTKADRLARLFGDAVRQITRAFLALDEAQLDMLLMQYGRDYGAKAESYARMTFPAWKSGATQLSGQTMQRLIALVPPYLSAATRFGLLQEVLKKQSSSSARQVNKSIRVSTKEFDAGFAELDAALRAMHHEDLLAHIPEHVMDAAKWLYADDMTAARGMLAEATWRKNEIMKASAIEEIELLRRTVRTGQVKEAHYNVQMPAGSLTVEVFTPPRTLREMLFG